MRTLSRNPFCAIFVGAQGYPGRCNVPLTEGLAMARKLVSKKELKTVYGIPYCFAHIARLEAAQKKIEVRPDDA